MRLEEIPIRIVCRHPVFGRSIMMADEKAGVLETGVPQRFDDWPLNVLASWFVLRFRNELVEALREPEVRKGKANLPIT